MRLIKGEIEMENLIGKKVQDKDRKYKGDIGVVEEIKTTKEGKEWCLVKWEDDTIHDGSYGMYSPKKFGGMFSRFEVIDK